MYKVFDGHIWIEFESYKVLINYLKGFEREGLLGKYNSFFEKVAGNDNDVMLNMSSYYTYINGDYVKRPFRITNEYGANLYSKKLIRDVTRWKFSPNMEAEHVKKMRYKANNGRIYIRQLGYVKENGIPKFRIDSWPGTSSKHNYRGYRHIRTFNEIKHSYDDDCKEFIRGTRGNHLPTIWDEGMRDWRNNGWKSQQKNKHQWENKVKQKTKHSHGKNTYVCKYNKYDYAEFGDLEDMTA